RYTYLPLVGVFIMIAWGARARSMVPMGPVLAAPATLVLAALAALALAACAACTWRQLGYWKSDEPLFRHALEVTSRNAVAHDNLATVLARQGRSEEAIRHFGESLLLKPDDAEVHNNLGIELARQGKLDEAASHYAAALRLEPDFAAAHC